ncbi:hypothetical protein pb186bvf_016559 [Paramecium bursaria]
MSEADRKYEFSRQLRSQVQDYQRPPQPEFILEQRLQSAPNKQQLNLTANPCNPCPQGPEIRMNVFVVSKEEIEAPWRLECEYLQSIINELQNSREQVVEKERIVEKIVRDDSKILELESRLTTTSSSYESQLSSLRNELQQLKFENGSLKSQLSGGNIYESRYNQLDLEFKKSKNSYEDQLGLLRIQINELVLARAKLQGELDAQKDIIRNKDQEIKRLQDRIQGLQSQSLDTSQLDELRLKLRLANDRIDQLQGDNLSLQSQINIQQGQFQNQLGDLQLQLRSQEATNSGYDQEIGRLRSELRQKEDEINQLNLELLTLREQKETVITERIREESNEAQHWRRNFENANHELNQARADLNMVQAELEAFKKSKNFKESQTFTSSRVTTSSRVAASTARRTVVPKEGDQQQ